MLLRDSIEERNNDIDKLMEYSHKVTPGFIAVSDTDEVAHTRIRGGAESELALTADRTVVVYPGSEKAKDVDVKVSAEIPEAPLKAGEKVGSYTVTLDGAELESGDLLAARDVEPGGFLSRYYISDHAAILGAAVLIAYLGFVFFRLRRLW